MISGTAVIIEETWGCGKLNIDDVRQSSPMTTPVRVGPKRGPKRVLLNHGGSRNLSPYSTLNLGFKSWRSISDIPKTDFPNIDPEMMICSNLRSTCGFLLMFSTVFHFNLGKVSVKKWLFLIPQFFFCWWNYAYNGNHPPPFPSLTNDAWNRNGIVIQSREMIQGISGAEPFKMCSLW